MEMEDDTGQRPKFGFRIYENFRNIVKKSSRSSNYDLSEVSSPTYEDVEVTGSHALSSLDSSMTNDRDKYFPRKSKLFRNPFENFETFPNLKKKF